VVLWREQGLQNPDEIVRAYEDASKSFRDDKQLQWTYVDATSDHQLAAKYGVRKLPQVQYYAARQLSPRGRDMQISYVNPNILAGVVIDPGFLATKLRQALNSAEQATREAECRDSEGVCRAWAQAGECSKNTAFMLASCKRSCLDMGVQAACPGVTSTVPKLPQCYDEAGPVCAQWARQGQCEANAQYMQTKCRFSCRQCSMSDEDRRLAALLYASQRGGGASMSYHQQVQHDQAVERQSKALHQQQRVV